MQLSDINKRHPLVFLSQLPKERIVLDYVLSKLAKNSSPERYDLIAAVFNLHLTSAGFDPMALSKARFKRVKASEFRQALREIDAEIALILQTEEYRQVLSRQTYLPDLFQQYLKMSVSVRQSGNISTQEFRDFAELLREKDAGDLILGFIRQHYNLFEESFSEDELRDFLRDYNELVIDQHRKNNLVKSVLELRLSEMLSMRGIRITQEINRLWQYFGENLTAEQNMIAQFDLFDKVLRTGVLTAWPARNLKYYLGFMTDKTEAYHFNQYAKRFPLFLALAEYLDQPGITQRMSWLDEAVEIARKLNNGRMRAHCLLVRAKVLADTGDIPMAFRALDEAEHHIHRIQERYTDIRNLWIEIAMTRVVLYTISFLENQDPYQPQILEAQSYLIADAGRHREDTRLKIMMINAINSFIQKNWIGAYESFTQALQILKEEEEDQPLHIISGFFCALLLKSAKPEVATLEIRRLEDMREPFFSITWVRLMQNAMRFYTGHTHTSSAL